MALVDQVRDEVAWTHRFIQAWIRGELGKDPGVFAPFAARFAGDFTLIGPTGSRTEPGGGVELVRGMHGTNPDFEIWIDDVRIERETATLVVATYTEWQRHAIHTPHGFNGRWSTAVFDRRGDALRWAWLHETWLPDEVLAAIPHGDDR